MAISTKGKKTGGSTPKEIQPGNNTCKINEIFSEDVKWKDGAKHLIIQMETEPIGGDFEGFAVDKNDPAKGKFLGQVARVKAGEWPFSDGKTKGGVQIFREDETLRFIMSLFDALGKRDWLDKATAKGDEFESVDALIEFINKEKPFDGIFLDCCIAGKEYKNKQGYDTHDLFLPKFSRKGVPFEKKGTNSGKLLKFDASEHIKKNPKAESVDEFAPSVVSKDTKKGFDID